MSGCLRLFSGSFRDALDGFHNLLSLCRKFFQSCRGILGQHTAVFHGLDGILDHFLRVSGRFRGFSSQVSHFIGHNGKALSGNARAGSFHCRVQCENIGLERDIVNGFDDTLNLLRRFLDLLHSGDKILHFLLAFFDLNAGRGCQLTRRVRILGVLADLFVDFLYGGGKLLNGTGLFRGTLAQSLRAGCHLIRARGDLVGGSVNFTECFTERGAYFFHRECNFREIADVFQIHLNIEISLCDLEQFIVDILNILFQLLTHLIDSIGEHAKLGGILHHFR